MKKKLLKSSFFFIYNCKSFESDWKRGFGGSGSDEARELLLIDDYIYIFISSNSIDVEGIKNNGFYDVYIVKYDKDVNVDVKFIRIFNINKKRNY